MIRTGAEGVLLLHASNYSKSNFHYFLVNSIILILTFKLKKENIINRYHLKAKGIYNSIFLNSIFIDVY